MAEITASSSRSGGVTPPAPAVYTVGRRINTRQIVTLLILTGLVSVVAAGLVATGWLAFGDRANISRRDLNPVEIIAIVGFAVWGIFSLWTALDVGRRGAGIKQDIADYLSRQRLSVTVLYALLTLAVITVGTLLVAEQVVTGWLALGDRVNISRRDFNWLEIATVALALVWGLVNLRALIGALQRDARLLAWAQWLLLINAIIGLVVLLSAVFDMTPDALPEAAVIEDGLQRTLYTLSYLAALYAPGLLLLLSAMTGYQMLSAGVYLRADQAVRNALSRIPGAGAIIGFIAILIFFSVASDLFLEPRALAGALTTNITRGVVAIGITMLMISGEFDLSVGSQLGSIGLIFLLAMTEGVLGLPPMSVLPAMIVAVVFASLLGFINGIILITTGIPSFIVTLGTLLAYRAIPLLIVPEGRILRYADYNIPQPSLELSPWVAIVGAALLILLVLFFAYRLLPQNWRRVRGETSSYQGNVSNFRDLAVLWQGIRLVITVVAVLGALALLVLVILDMLRQTDTLITVNLFELINGQFGFVPADVNLRTGVLWWFLLVLLMQFILTQTPYGNSVFAVGGNAGAARAQGISVTRVKVFNFVLCSWMVAIAAIMDAARIQSVDSTRGDGLELETIAASVIGGTLLTGGYGSIIGALLGVFIFGMLRTGLVLIGLNPRVFNGVIGVIIVVAVVINTFVRRERR